MGDKKRKEQSKKEAFDENPERFIDIEDLIIGAIRSTGPEGQNGVAYMINPKVSITLIKASAFDIQDQVSLYIQRRNMMAINQAKENGIIIPGDNGKDRIK